ncbi:MAG TPA: dephospho-CoA kinase [Mariprofundaceae bacterium]|nr:dephospho-CoA kinase [Mariprofundaceae bacterium]
MGQRPWVVGLTGGIGSGKSTVAGMLTARGVPVLDLDTVGHAVLMTHGGIREELKQAFGPEVLQPDGSPDRKAIGRIALATEDGTRRLGAIVHPHIWQEAEAWVVCQQAPYVVIEASVLIESGGAHRVDFVVVVMAGMEERRRRVLQRQRHSAEEFERIVARQCDDDERRRLADRIVRNDGDLEGLRQQVDGLHAELLARAERAMR